MLEYETKLNEIYSTYFEEIFMMLKTTSEIISTQSAKTPELEKLNSQMMKKLEELEKFQKHIIETVANKPMPKETKPHEGMYE